MGFHVSVTGLQMSSICFRVTVCRVSLPGSQMMLRRLREYGAEQVRRARACAGKGRILCLSFLPGWAFVLG